MKKVLFILAALIIASPVAAFHDGGVADCQGCHTMHNSQDGALVDPDAPNGNPWLLVDATPSDVCLGCHATRLGAVLGADPLAPPREIGSGNFVFLLEDNLNDGHGGGDQTCTDPTDPSTCTWDNPISGDAAGHNLNAPGHGLAVDGTLTSSPGGAYPAGVMSCTSCHDPHGTDEFRLLYGSGRIITQGNFAFTHDAPTAVGTSIFGGPPESQTSHTAYQGGMSGWCGNCHGDFHDNGSSSRLDHPSGTNLGGTIAQNYNLYNGTEDINGGAQATAYLAQVPFDDAANTTSSTAGPSATSQVMCLSCHRAHASSAVDAGRWDFQVTLLHEDGDESGSYELPDPYASTNQRSLCNKCHVKDAYDHIVPPTP